MLVNISAKPLASASFQAVQSRDGIQHAECRVCNQILAESAPLVIGSRAETLERAGVWITKLD